VFYFDTSKISLLCTAKCTADFPFSVTSILKSKNGMSRESLQHFWVFGKWCWM